MDERKFDLLLRLAGMFGSDNDNERSIAARKASDLLKAEKLTWKDVLKNSQTVEQKPSPQPKPEKQKAYSPKYARQSTYSSSFRFTEDDYNRFKQGYSNFADDNFSDQQFKRFKVDDQLKQKIRDLLYSCSDLISSKEKHFLIGFFDTGFLYSREEKVKLDKILIRCGFGENQQTYKVSINVQTKLERVLINSGFRLTREERNLCRKFSQISNEVVTCTHSEKHAIEQILALYGD